VGNEEQKSHQIKRQPFGVEKVAQQLDQYDQKPTKAQKATDQPEKQTGLLFKGRQQGEISLAT
jgi:hypothetical protein